MTSMASARAWICPQYLPSRRQGEPRSFPSFISLPSRPDHSLELWQSDHNDDDEGSGRAVAPWSEEGLDLEGALVGAAVELRGLGAP